ncbi:MAG: hypothetical protein AB8B74_03240 [Crocinitomicaceae bacterium]
MTARVLFYLSLLAVTTIVAVLKYRKLSSGFKYLTFLLILTLCVEVAAKILEVKTGSSFSIYHYFIVGALVFNFFIYLNLIVVKKYSLIVMLGMTIFFIFLSVINSIFIQSADKFPSNGIMLHSFQIIVFVMLTYLNMLKFPVKTSIYKQPVFWLNTGNLVFYGVTFSIFSFYNLYYQSAKVGSAGYQLIYIANILLYSSYLIAILLDSKLKDE